MGNGTRSAERASHDFSQCRATDCDSRPGSIDDLIQLKAVEKEVWGLDDEDALPLTMAIACQAVGSIFVGAFDKDS